MNYCNDCEHLKKERNRLFPYDRRCTHPDAPRAGDMAAHRTIHSTTFDMRNAGSNNGGFCRSGEPCPKLEQAEPPQSMRSAFQRLRDAVRRLMGSQ